MDLPVYGRVGLRLVRAIATPEGGVAVQVWDPVVREFVNDKGFGEKLLMTGDDTDYLTAEEFEELLAVEKARTPR